MRVFWVVLGLAMIAIVLWTLSLPVAGEPCKIERESKFYSTGKVAVCTQGRWVVKNGTMF